MKRSLRSFLVNLASLNSAIVFIPGINNSGGLKTLIIATFIYSLINIFIKPIISLLLLPINLITLGTFKWLVNVLVLFILTLVVSNIDVGSFTFQGFNYQGFIIPKIVFSKIFTLILGSMTISFTNIFINWLIEEE